MDKRKRTGKRKVEVTKEEEDEEVEFISNKKGKKSHTKSTKSNKDNVEVSIKKEKAKQGTLDKFNISIKPPESETDFSRLPELPKGKEIKICSWNVNGLRAMINKGAIENFIKNENPDILCLNETKIDITALKKDKFDKIYSEDYMSFWNCCRSKGGYSGVAIFTKFRPIGVKYGIDHEDHDEEGRVLTLEFEDFYIVSVYVPNAGEGLKRLDYRIKHWDTEFFKYLNTLKEKKNVILCGDFNVAHKEIDIYEVKGHLKSAGFTPEERESFTNFLDQGYVDTFRHFHPDDVKFSYFTARAKTAKTENKGWRLDYFIINEEAMEHVVDSDIYQDFIGSDHMPIKLIYKL